MTSIALMSSRGGVILPRTASRCDAKRRAPGGRGRGDHRGRRLVLHRRWLQEPPPNQGLSGSRRSVWGFAPPARCLVQERNLGSLLERLLKPLALIRALRRRLLRGRLCGGFERQADREAGPAVGALAGVHRPAVGGGDGADDAEAEPGPAPA